MQFLSEQNFKVIVRVRPLQNRQQQQMNAYQQAQNKKFKNSSNKMIKLSPSAYSFYTKFYNITDLSKVMKVDDNTVYVIDPEYKNTDKKLKPYSFSNVYSQQQTSKHVFDECLLKDISCVLEGYNYTILAYGITGSGKTHTVFGNSQKKQYGISSLTLNYLLQKKLQIQSQSNSTKVNLKFSFVQIYNENVRDLLSHDCKFLNIVEDSKGVTTFNDAIQKTIQSKDQIQDLIDIGLAKRSSGATSANQYSSRSHAILQMNVEIISEQSKTNSKLFIIDLAGSQKLQTLNCAKKMQEGANINKSLLSLGNCINILAQNTKKGLISSASHIPYRDSKLTRILKDSLGGNAKTLMISCISSNPFTIQQTITTLNYSQRAQGIKKQIKKNKNLQQPKLCKNCSGQIVNESFQKIKIPKHLLEQKQHKQNTFFSLFNQIYQDIVENVKESQSIQRLTLNGKQPCRQIQKLKIVNNNQKAELKETMFKLFHQRKSEYNQKLTELKIFVESFNQTQDKKIDLQLKTDKYCDQNILNHLERPFSKSISKISPLQRKPLMERQSSNQNSSTYFDSLKFLLPQENQKIDYHKKQKQQENRFSFASLLETNSKCQNVQQTNKKSNSAQKILKKRSRSKFEVVKKMSTSKIQSKEFDSSL